MDAERRLLQSTRALALLWAVGDADMSRAKRTDADRPTLSRTSARHVGFRVSVDAPRSETY
jgi:hypothetical protein